MFLLCDCKTCSIHLFFILIAVIISCPILSCPTLTFARLIRICIIVHGSFILPTLQCNICSNTTYRFIYNLWFRSERRRILVIAQMLHGRVAIINAPSYIVVPLRFIPYIPEDISSVCVNYVGVTVTRFLIVVIFVNKITPLTL